jgi:type IV fimbrial biogenesis protein FimT
MNTSSDIDRVPYRNGFSLIELMIVIAIIGIIAAGSMELFTSLTQNQRVRSASFEIYSTLAIARSEALKRGVNVTVFPVNGADWSRGWEIWYPDASSADDMPDASGKGRMIRSQTQVQQVIFTTSSTPLASVTFTRTGRPVAQAWFGFQVSEYKKCVSLDLSGSPRTKTGVCP